MSGEQLADVRDARVVDRDLAVGHSRKIAAGLPRFSSTDPLNVDGPKLRSSDEAQPLDPAGHRDPRARLSRRARRCRVAGAAFGFAERVRIGEGHRSQLRVGDGAVIIGDAGGDRRPPQPGEASHSVMVRVATRTPTVSVRGRTARASPPSRGISSTANASTAPRTRRPPVDVLADARRCRSRGVGRDLRFGATGSGLVSETHLILPVPAAEPFVGAHRASFDPSARAGMPAHITVLGPFIERGALSSGDLSALGELFAATARSSSNSRASPGSSMPCTWSRSRENRSSSSRRPCGAAGRVNRPTAALTARSCPTSRSPWAPRTSTSPSCARAPPPAAGRRREPG